MYIYHRQMPTIHAFQHSFDYFHMQYAWQFSYMDLLIGDRRHLNILKKYLEINTFLGLYQIWTCSSTINVNSDNITYTRRATCGINCRPCWPVANNTWQWYWNKSKVHFRHYIVVLAVITIWSHKKDHKSQGSAANSCSCLSKK